MLSATSNVVVFVNVLVPFTVKSPVIIVLSSMVTVPPAESIVRFPLSVSISLSPVIPTLILPAFKPDVVISALEDISPEELKAPWMKPPCCPSFKYPTISTSGSVLLPPSCGKLTS